MFKPETLERNLIIIALKKKGMYYKDIAEKVGCSVSIVTNVVWEARKSGMLDIIVPDAHNALQTLRAAAGGEKGGNMPIVCKTMGHEAVRWVFKSKPDGVTFAEYVGYIVKDVYEEEKETK
jgi:hypothetical protein